MAYDGSLKFDTKVDTSGFDGGISTLQKAIDRLSQTIDRLSHSITSAFQGMGNAAQAVSAKSDEAAAEVQGIGQAAEQAEAKVKSLQEQMDAISVHTMQDDAVSTTQTPISVPTSAESMGYDPKAMEMVFGEAAAAIRAYADAVAQYGNGAGMAMNTMVEESIKAASSTEALAEQVPKYVRFKDSIISAFQGMPGALRNIMGRIPGIVSSAFSKAVGVVKSFGNALLNVARTGIGMFTSKIKSMGQASQKACKPIFRLSNMLKLMLIRMALRGVIQGAREGFQNLAQYSEDANKSISMLMSALTRLKNSFATAFAPILDAAAPALTALINLLSKAATYMAQLMAAFTGKSTFVRAKEVQQDYAASLKGTGSAAKQAGKEAKKALAPFDELTQMQKDTADAGGGASGISPADMFETVEVEGKIADFAKQIKDLWAAEDYEGIGILLADKANAGLQKLYDVLNWDNVGPKITPLIEGFTGIFNSLVDNLDWDLLGRTVGTGVNTVVNALNLLITGIDWKNLGKKFATGLNGLVSEVDWSNLGQLIGNKIMIIPRIVLGFVQEFDWSGAGLALGTGINGAISRIDPVVLAQGASGLVKGLLDAVSNAMIATDWQAIGNKIAEFFKNIDYSGIFTSLSYGIGVALASLAEFIYGLIEDAWSGVMKWWEATAFEDGKFTIKGLLNGIWEAMKNIGVWIKDHIFKPFLDGFRDAFGIHSPSTIMKEMGGLIIDGLHNGISEKVKGVIGLCSSLVEGMKPVFNGMIDFISGVFTGNWSRAWDGLKDIFKGTFSGILSIAERALNYIVDKLNSLSFTVPGWVPGMGGKRFSFNIPRVTLPRLATGTVVPPRAGEFAAILGDNNREAEVVSPVSTMKQAFKEAIAEMGGLGSGDVNVYLEGDAEGVFRLVRAENTKYRKQTGKPAFT